MGFHPKFFRHFLITVLLCLPTVFLCCGCSEEHSGDKKPLRVDTSYSSLRKPGPFDLLTREHLAVLMLKAKKIEPPPDYCESGAPFTDVSPDMESCSYIKKLNEIWSREGIRTGYVDGTFRPHGFVTREEMAAFIVRAKEGDPPDDYCNDDIPYDDVPAWKWSCKYIKRLKILGAGPEGNSYSPDDTVTFSEVETALGRLFP
jgi:hypothetical protein